MKVALRKTVGRSLLTFDELRTVLCEVETRINDRPLMLVSKRARADFGPFPDWAELGDTPGRKWQSGKHLHEALIAPVGSPMEDHRPSFESLAARVHHDDEPMWEMAEDPGAATSRRHRTRRRPRHTNGPLVFGPHP
ncbi:hypothetical protein T07_301 [Trichinella nelsoni]|uniref:Uncharacterized protein n=1 Tax=Trichinella nelsoni TaxID=6336 RepID=A0A0V0RS78_9BILA|nr:hypothetical protein T07_301 [Trichinella nelsoni]